MKIARIIVIENEPIIAMDIEEALSGAGLEVVGVAPSLTRAFEMHSECPADVILLDSDSTNGDAPLPWFGPPVVLIASRGELNGGGALRLAHRCVCTVVPKPFLSGHLLDAVACALRQQPCASERRDSERHRGRRDNRRWGLQD